jgi:hypothetical protein
VDLSSEVNTTGGRVVRFGSLEGLASRAADWDRLARGVPFRGWAWASHWWRHYGQGQEGKRAKTELFTLGVLDPAGALAGIAPWYVESSAAEGRVVRFLATGEVCSDYLSVLCAPGKEAAVADALADWLTGKHALVEADALTPAHASEGDRPANHRHQGVDRRRRERDRWDLLELTGVDAEDTVVRKLAQSLEARGNTVHRRAGPRFWRIELPTRWEDYLAQLSKDHRKKARRSVRGILASGRVAVRRVERLQDLEHAQDVLIDLHQRRRRRLGEPGAFASTRFNAFHREVMADLLLTRQLYLQWLELDGRPVAAEYGLAGDGVIYAYQSGVDPDALEHSPGRLSHIVMLQGAIEQGYRALDLLRGDEPYKAHWRARPRESAEIRVVPARPTAQLRHGLWRAGTGMKEWIKSGLRMTRG